jgi:hypothetical protein
MAFGEAPGQTKGLFHPGGDPGDVRPQDLARS